jgi:hypothetical protein
MMTPSKEDLTNLVEFSLRDHLAELGEDDLQWKSNAEEWLLQTHKKRSDFSAILLFRQMEQSRRVARVLEKVLGDGDLRTVKAQMRHDYDTLFYNLTETAMVGPARLVLMAKKLEELDLSSQKFWALLLESSGEALDEIVQ